MNYTTQKGKALERAANELRETKCAFCGGKLIREVGDRGGLITYRCTGCSTSFHIPKELDNAVWITRGKIVNAVYQMVELDEKICNTNFETEFYEVLKFGDLQTDPLIKMAFIAYITNGFKDQKAARKYYNRLNRHYQRAVKWKSNLSAEDAKRFEEWEGEWLALRRRIQKRIYTVRSLVATLVLAVIFTAGILVGTGQVQAWINTVRIRDDATGITVTSTVDYLSREVTLSVTEKRAGDSEYYAASDLLAKETTGVVVYDLSLANNTQFGGTMSVSVPIPEKINSEFAVVYYMKDSETVTEIPSEVKDGWITYETNHFSLYIIAEKTSKGLRYALQGDEKSYAVIGYEGTLSGISIPDTYNGIPVTAIEREAFHSSDLTEITLSDQIVKIGERAFAYSNGIPKITIPKTVTDIAASAFMGWQETQTVFFVGRGIPDAAWNGWDHDCSANVTYELPRYSIEYHLNGGENAEANPSSYTEDTPSFVFQEPTRTGYLFKGWFSDAVLTQAVTDVPMGSAAAMTVYAAWDPIQYTVLFQANGGEGTDMPTMNRIYDDGKPLPANQFSREGYIFVGWNVDRYAKVALYADKVIENITAHGGNVTLYAIWQSLQYELTFDTAGGTSIATKLYHFGDEVEMPEDPVKAGYRFEGWSLQLETMPSHDVVVTAQWRKIHTITYAGDAGTMVGTDIKTFGTVTGTMESDTILDGDTYVLREPAYSKTSWTFQGWKNGNDGSLVAPGTNVDVTSDVTYSAVWEIKKQQTIYNSQPFTVTRDGTEQTFFINLDDHFDFNSLIQMECSFSVDLYVEATSGKGKKKLNAVVGTSRNGWSGVTGIVVETNYTENDGASHVFTGTQTSPAYQKESDRYKELETSRQFWVGFTGDGINAYDYTNNEWTVNYWSISITFY